MKLIVTFFGLIILLSGYAFAQDSSLDDIIAELFTSNPIGQPQPTPRPVQPAGNIDSITRTTPPPQVQPQPVQTCVGECVPYYQCNNNSLVTDGSGLIDIRIDDGPRQCNDYLEVCCGASDKLTEPEIPVVSPKTGCGYRNTQGVGFRISGDTDNEAEFGEFPWMVAVLREEKGLAQTLSVYQCGASLIHPNVVLTAAHCVDGKVATSLKIRVGEWDTQTMNEIYPHQDREVSSMVVHPQYTKSNLVNDIALLFLRSPVAIEAHINTACLPPQDFNFDRSRCVASGWGKNVFGKEGKYQVILKKINLPMVPFSQCQNALRTTRLGNRFQLSNTFVCAGGEPNQDTCKGDGGSPLLCPVNGSMNQYYQSGIVAWGIGCGENQIPGVYVNVAKFRNWIDGEMRRRNYNTQSYTA